MFENIGEKIQKITKIFCIVGMVLCVVMGIIQLVSSGEANDLQKQQLITSGIVWLLVGPVACWLGSLVLYAFGRLVANSDKLVANMEAQKGTKYKAQGKTLHGKEEEQFWAKIAKANEKQAEAGKKQSTWECPICGAKNDSGQMVCKECGKARY